MKLSPLLLMVALIPGIALGQSPASGSAPAAGSRSLLIKPGQQILFLGDSTIQGGWLSASGFIRLVNLGLAKENVPIKPGEMGTMGNRPQELLALYEKNVATMSPKPDWLVVSCGLDEVRAGLPGSDLPTFQENMKSLVDKAKAAGIKVMLLTTNIAYETGSPADKKVAAYNDALRALAKDENCPLTDLNAVETATLKTMPPGPGNTRLLMGEATLNTHGQRLAASEILKTFGVSPAQLAEIQESWLDAPKSATAGPITARLNGTVPITLRQYNGLEAVAMNRHQPLQTLLSGTYAADVIAALRAADPSADMTAIQKSAQSLFEKDIANLLKDIPAPAAPTNAATSPISTPATSAGDGVLVKSGQKVAFMGDSITQFGWQHPDGYVNLVIRGLATAGVQVEPIPAGVSGNTSRDMLGRLKTSVLDKQPDWMTLSCGVNDVWHGLTGCDLETYKKNITSIVDQAQTAKIQVMILTATMIQEVDNANNQKLAAYNDFLRGMAHERKLPLADLNEAEREALKSIPTDAPYRHLTVDGVHMNAHGNEMMALGVLKAFGLSDAQLAQVKEHWLDDPNGSSADANAGIYCGAAITLRESDALELQAAANKRPILDSLTPLCMEALIEQAKSDPNATDLAALQTAAQVLFTKKVTDLAKSSAPSGQPVQKGPSGQ